MEDKEFNRELLKSLLSVWHPDKCNYENNEDNEDNEDNEEN